MNPLLSAAELPLFDQILPEHVASAMDQLLTEADTALETVTQPGFPATWNGIATVLDVATERLGRSWGAVSHLNSVADSPELRAAYNAALPRITEFWTRLGCDERLYAKYKAIAPDTLDAAQRHAHAHALRDFVLGGAELQGQDRERFAAIQERQAELSQKFSENALDATDKFALYAQAGELEGVPEDVLQSAAAAARAEGREGHKLSLKMPCYMPVMQFARSGALRERMYRAYTTRASEQADDVFRRYDNTTLIHEVLALRAEESRLLGFHDFAELSLATKMADSPAAVMGFLRDLATRARPFAEQDLAELRAFAADHLGMAELQPWDLAYAGEKLKEHRYAFSELAVKQYFPLPRVLAGLFKIAETLFEVRIQPDQAPIWNPGVQFFRIERPSRSAVDGQTNLAPTLGSASPPEGGPSFLGRPGERLSTLVGQFYLDPAARTGKRGGAWMDDVRSRWLRPDTHALQTPVAHLVCNFAEGAMVNGERRPALLTHDDVITLFHEFGHGLHHMLTRVNEHHVSGISGVEWDAVELPSQFMENFCWEWDVLRHMSSHADTGAPLPRELFDKMLAARNFQSGMQTLRQIEFALFDMLLHTDHVPGADITALLERVRAEVAVVRPPLWSRTANTFSHIFAGGYAAGYYSYKWAEVLSADAYAAFEESMDADGSPSPAMGRKYRQEILEVGGSRPAMESFKAFRGRAPTLDALLRHQGMTTSHAAR